MRRTFRFSGELSESVCNRLLGGRFRNLSSLYGEQLSHGDQRLLMALELGRGLNL